PKIIVDKSFKGDSLGAIINIDTATTKGDTLFLKVSYSGGCKEHKFKLYWNGGYMKSMPPQAKLYLFHNNNGDVCRRLIKETIKFNVSPIQYQGQHTVILSVNKYKQRIKYKY
ncbi:hypothetical protein JYU20_04960, partial [Bacteroidales bacterium AH-315-I05]|nr:hypothetical protein [Bacteroidales bacterium AH-315-I05]